MAVFIAINDEESNSMEGKLLLKFHEKEGLELLTQRRPWRLRIAGIDFACDHRRMAGEMGDDLGESFFFFQLYAGRQIRLNRWIGIEWKVRELWFCLNILNPFHRIYLLFY